MKQKLIWSRYQKAIFDDIKNGKDGENTVVIARAGSSKTTCLVEGVKYIPKKKKTLFVCFNKAIQETLEDRIGKSYIECRTNHSKGFSTIKNAFGSGVKLDQDKTLNITQSVLQEKGFKKLEIALSMCRAVDLCKSSLIDTPSKIDVLLDKFDIETFSMEREDFISTICQVMRKCKEVKNVVDFTEMLWFPYIFGLGFEKYDRVVLDEAQDVSPAQLHIALSSCKKDGRILAVADDRQTINTFAGVDINSVNLLIDRLNAKVLPLPISYRCATSIIKLAQEIVPDIEAATYADEGTITDIKEKDFLTEVRPGDFILSRVNAPLIYYALALLRMNVPANILGRDIGNGLAYMIKKSGKETVPEFQRWLDLWKGFEIARLQAKGRDPILVIDKAACLETLCEGARNLDDVRDNIKKLFTDGDDSSRVILSSIHRSKGAERNRVFLCMWTLRDTSTEELNIKYVGITRCKTHLFRVNK